MKAKENRGITLIALIVTIIVLLILAGVTIYLTINGKGIFYHAKRSAFVHDMKAYQEEVNLIKGSDSLATANGENVESIYVGLKKQKQPDTITVIKDLKKTYQANGDKENQVIIQDTEMYYNYVGTKQSQERVKWCFENNIPVWGYSSYDDFKEKNGISDDSGGGKSDDTGEDDSTSEYTKVGDTYANSPDLSNFSKEATYYVTYDSDGNNPTIVGRIDRLDPPTNWYNYGNKIWANVVTVTHSQVAYWTWIPKYVYKTDSSAQIVDAKFVDINGNSKDTSGNSVDVTGYATPDSFKFADKNLYGYWISKYEVSDTGTRDIVFIESEDNAIQVSSKEDGNYTIFVNGVSTYTGALPYTISNLDSTKMYDISVAKGDQMLKREQVRPKEKKINLAKFNPEATYYVTYDSDGNNQKIAGRIDKISEPSNWYDYKNKRWANIVTVTNSEVAYWTWIPRFEYKVNSDQTIEAVFVRNNVIDNPNSIFRVPDSFTFNGQQLPGYWISKYEISETIPENISFEATASSLKVVTDATDNANYDLYINGTKSRENVSLPYIITGLKSNTQYDICVVKNGSNPVYRGKQTTKKLDIDLSKFNASCTYYVTYDDSGNETLTPISAGEPANWYDYTQKKWANICTTANGTKSYWVWIPRFKYRLTTSNQFVDAEIVTTDVTNANCESLYKIPDSFTFNGVELPGYWISKYEISDVN